ncbi:hypothetical protein NUW58_g7488 [Xylaria curta]|uniref:Uncharacterized protein n=1 Tax=Xylaria curta TaxID=42375 RepID=A0ACC1NHN9_9PEZI|nr:hypothetical protein NUW58_g7488 [Xylaria curta]
MATIVPRVSRAAPSLGRLARITHKFTSADATALRATRVTPLRALYMNSNQTRYVSSQTSPSSKHDNTQTPQSTPRVILPEFDLKGKVIVAYNSLSQSTCLIDSRNHQPTRPTREQSRGPGTSWARRVFYHQVDVRTGVDSLNSIVEGIAEQHGRVDGLIAAAGIQQETPALDYKAADADRMLGVNVTGVLMTSQAVARQMIRLGSNGSIVLIASMSGTVANRGLICPVYNASKAAVLQLGRNLAMEWGVKGIRVNTISPGYIVTEMVQKLFDQFPERETEWPKHNMLNKLSKPEDYRGAAVFLLSDASRFMTGADLRIDGGHAAW